MEEILNNIITFILFPRFEGPFFLLRIVFIIFSLGFAVFAIWAHLNSGWLQRFFLEDVFEITTYKPYAARELARRWSKIVERLKAGIESEYKLAIIEADTMLEDILKGEGYAGETIGDRLKQITSDILPNIEEVQKAHQIRNSIIHDPDYRLTLDEARSVLSVYEKAVQNLQAF